MDATEAKMGRVFILRLHDGERLDKVIEAFAAEHQIAGAMCFFLGGAQEKSALVTGPRDGAALPPDPMVTLLRGVHEACGVGTIFSDEQGHPKLHMHASFGRNGQAVTGCVRAGVDIWQIGEVVVIELTGSVARRARDKKTGFEVLETV